MPLKKPIYQLSLGLELEDEGGGDEAALRSEAARQALERLYGKIGAPKWLDDYLELRAGGWPWRVAGYIAWASTPRVSRDPRSQEALAREYLGLTSDRMVTTWRKRNPAIDAMVEVLQGAPLFKHRAEIITALVVSAVKPDYRHHADRKLALELMGDAATKSVSVALSKRGLAVDDLVEMSDSELAEIAAALNEEEIKREVCDDSETG